MGHLSENDASRGGAPTGPPGYNGDMSHQSIEIYRHTLHTSPLTMLTQTFVDTAFYRTAQGVAWHSREIAMIWDVKMILMSHSLFFFFSFFIYINE